MKWNFPFIIIPVAIFSMGVLGYIVGSEIGKRLETENEVLVNVLSIYDGDTFKVNIDGFPPICGKEISIRIRGIDAPEIKSRNKRIRESLH